MASRGNTLEWCIVRLGEDYNWWVQEISDEVHWDVEGLSIIDPRQLAHLVDLIEPLREYDFRNELLENAFYTFKIASKLDGNQLKLARTNESIFDAVEPVFALPDIIDEEKSPYADLLDHISRLRVRMLNDLIEFEQRFTLEELEEELREEHNNFFLEGNALHVFRELTDVLEFVPAGYELDEEETKSSEPEDEIEDEFPEIDEEEEERLKKEERLEWDEDDDESDESAADEELTELDDDDDDDED
ncbi:MAG: hypothetical protein ACFB21_10545 [Opitutales bacterium]